MRIDWKPILTFGLALVATVACQSAAMAVDTLPMHDLTPAQSISEENTPVTLPATEEDGVTVAPTEDETLPDTDTAPAPVETAEAEESTEAEESEEAPKASGAFTVSAQPNYLRIDTSSFEGYMTCFAPDDVFIESIHDLVKFEVYTMRQDGDKSWLPDQLLPMEGKLQLCDPATGEVLTVDYDPTASYEEVLRILTGASYTLTEPGLYYALGILPDGETGTQLLISIDAREPLNVRADTAEITVNETIYDAQTYTLPDDHAYFKLRDVAQMLSGTDKQFDIAWNDTEQRIDLTSGTAYTPVGGELDLDLATVTEGHLNTADIFCDGVAVEVKSYNINGNNYFKIRDLAEVLGVAVSDVDWGDSKTLTLTP